MIHPETGEHRGPELKSASQRVPNSRDELGGQEQNRTMKIKVESEKIVKAVQKIHGIEMVLESVDDAKEALNLILKKEDVFKEDPYTRIKEMKVSSFQEYKTSAVNYRMIFLLEFVFQDGVSAEAKVAFVKGLQDFFNKA